MNLDTIPLFSTLGNTDLAALAASTRTVDLPPGRILCDEDEAGNSMFVVLEGRLEVIKAFRTADHRLLAVLAPGEFVGELSLIMKKNRRTATVRAQGNARILELSRSWFESATQTHPRLTLHIMRKISERLCAADEAIIRDLRSKNAELALACHQLKEAQAELVEKEKLEHELSMARKIQAGILPSAINSPEGCDIGATMEPARSVGGDFFDAIPLDSHSIAIAIGDVSDKGIPAAMFMAQFCTLLRVWAEPGTPPEQVLTRVNNHLVRANDEGLFVTCIYGIYDSKTGRFSYARAGHEPPLIIDQKKGITRPEKKQGLALCLFPDPEIDVQEIVLPRGSTLVMYTDGCTDAQDSDGNFLGQKRFEGIALDHLGGSAQGFSDGVVQELMDFQGHGLFDDVTFVGVRCL
ncbi:MAG: SpoIIE family protein phosphatase [Desulfobacterales bacterium]|nr:SpoIIE family protein phosphatase [Desulfobacterales bacterium]